MKSSKNKIANIVDTALTIEPRLTWEDTPEGLRGTYCGPRNGKSVIVSAIIKDSKSLNIKELTVQIHNLSTALRAKVHLLRSKE